MQDESKEFSKNKEKSMEKELYFRNRQSFMMTKVNIQQVVPSDQIYPNMPTYYGFAAEKSHVPFLEQMKSDTLNRNY